MTTRFKQIFIALLFALVFAGLTLVAASAQGPTPPPTSPTDNKNDCAQCHTDFVMSWQIGAHGQATIDPVFVEEWKKQGNPSACLGCHVTGYNPATASWKADGVTCEACHTDTGGDHPKTPMSVDTTPKLCGSCHTDTRFGWSEWQGSTHYQSGMACTNCHDPHSASIKIASGQTFHDASQLCVTCHKDMSADSSHSVHLQNGVTCADCHISQIKTELGTHTVPDHSFKATLDRCTSCHKDQMHASGTTTGTNGTTGNTGTTSNASPELNQASVLPEPTAVSPLGYAGIAALIGLAIGMLLAPWLERWYRLALQKADEVQHDGK